VTRAFPAALVGLAAAISGLGAVATVANASALPGAKATVAALRSEVLYQAHEVHHWAELYQSDAATANYVRAEGAAERESLWSLRAHLGRTRALLEQQAVLAYAGGLSNASTIAASPDDTLSQMEKAGYEDVALGDISSTLAQFQAQEAAVARAAAIYGRELRADLAALSSAAAARDQAISQAGTLQALLSTAEAHVASLEAASQAPTGLPVGDGIVNAVEGELAAPAGSTTPAAPRRPVAGPIILGPGPGTSAARAITAATLRPRSPTTSATADPPPTTVAATTSAVTTTTTLSTTTTTTSTTTATSDPATTVPATTVPATTVPATTVPATTVPATTVPATTTSTAPATTTTPAPTDASGTTSGGQAPPAGGAWLELRECESGDNYQENTGNGFYGAYQFAASTWSGLGYPGRPDLEPYWMQDQAAERLQSQSGWSPWPACSAALGL